MERAGDLVALYGRITALLERAPAEVAAPPLASEIEEVLTEGYAHAIRMDSRVASDRRHAEELAAAGGSDEQAAETAALLRLAAHRNEEVRRLRDLLDALRSHRRAGRAALAERKRED